MSGDPVSTARSRGTWLRNRAAVATAVALVGLIVTGVVSATAWHLDQNSERRLLQVQTRQAGALLSSAIVGSEAPLQTSLDVAAATGGQAPKFVRYIDASVGPGRPFTSATLWDTSTPTPTVLAMAGSATSSAATIAMVKRAVHGSTFLVTSIGGSGIGYALADPGDPRYVVYAEREIPANRRAPVERGSAFSDLNFATYLGRRTSAGALATTDAALSSLPLRGTPHGLRSPSATP